MKRLFQQRWKIAFFRMIAPWITRLASPCTQIARFASEACDRKLSWRERWRMRIHFIICDWCRRYSAQIRKVHDLAPQLSLRAPQLLHRPMTDETRKRLKERLRAEGSR